MRAFESDSYFHIGAQHVRSGLPCEDYALHGIAGGVQYLVVSDGCSSGGRTDVGARLLAHTTARAIHGAVDAAWSVPDIQPEGLGAASDMLLVEQKGMLCLRDEDMLATRMVAVLVSEQVGFVRVFGDGIVVVEHTNGVRVRCHIEWDDNTPYYPWYRHSARNRFVEAHGGDYRNERITMHTVTSVRGAAYERHTDRVRLANGLDGIDIPLGNLDEVAMVGLFSDGLTQIEGVLWETAVDEALAFRSTTGAFLKRRMIRQLRQYERNGNVAQDDVAGAVLVLIQSAEE